MARLMLDTPVMVAMERNRLRFHDVCDLDRDDVALAALTAAELLHGAALDAGRTPQQDEMLELVFETLPSEPYDLDAARSHADLLAATRRSGRPRQAHDLIIAATARATDRTIVTLDRTGFDDLPGVVVRVPSGAA